MRSDRMMPPAVLSISSTALDRAKRRQRRGGLDCGKRQRPQRGRWRGFLGQAADADASAKRTDPGPRGRHCERNCKCRPACQEKYIGDCGGLPHRHSNQRDDSEQCMRPKIMQRQRQWYFVVVARLPDPADFAAEYQPGKKTRMAKPQNRAKQDRIRSFDAIVDCKPPGSSEFPAKLRPQKNINRTCNFWREPHHEDTNEQS